MALETVIFIIVSTITLITAWAVVTSRNLFHSALALMGSFLGVAALYVTLDAGFLAAAQLMVYIGAISILVIFAIMMTRRLMQTTETPFNSQNAFSAVTAVITFAVLLFVIAGMREYWPLQPDATTAFASRPAVDESVINGSVLALGRSFVSADAYVLPFEVASILMLGAMVGAVVVAWPKPEDEA